MPGVGDLCACTIMLGVGDLSIRHVYTVARCE